MVCLSFCGKETGADPDAIMWKRIRDPWSDQVNILKLHRSKDLEIGDVVDKL